MLKSKILGHIAAPPVTSQYLKCMFAFCWLFITAHSKLFSGILRIECPKEKNARMAFNHETRNQVLCLVYANSL